LRLQLVMVLNGQAGGLLLGRFLEQELVHLTGGQTP
jgi:hypothetical protein